MISNDEIKQIYTVGFGSGLRLKLGSTELGLIGLQSTGQALETWDPAFPIVQLAAYFLESFTAYPFCVVSRLREPSDLLQNGWTPFKFMRFPVYKVETTFQFILKLIPESWNMCISRHMVHHTFNAPHAASFNIYIKVVLIIPRMVLLYRTNCRAHQKCVDCSLGASELDVRHRDWLNRDCSIWAIIENVNEDGLFKWLLSPIPSVSLLHSHCWRLCSKCQ